MKGRAFASSHQRQRADKEKERSGTHSDSESFITETLDKLVVEAKIDDKANMGERPLGGGACGRRRPLRQWPRRHERRRELAHNGPLQTKMQRRLGLGLTTNRIAGRVAAQDGRRDANCTPRCTYR